MKFYKKIIYAACCFFVVNNARAQFSDQTGRAEWEIKDTSISAPFIKDYIKYNSKINKDDDGGFSILEDDRLVVEITMNDGNPTLHSLKVLARDGGFSNLDPKIVQSIGTKYIPKIIGRKYSWDEFNKNQLKDQRYASDIETIFELRNYKATRDVFWWSSSTIQFAIPSTIMIRLSERLGAEINLSNDEYGYIYPLVGGGPGILKLGFAHQIGKAYVTVPIKVTGKNLEGSYGGGLTFDEGNFGGGLMIQEIDFKRNGYKETQTNENSETTTLYLQNAGYIYLSKTHDLSKIVSQSTIRWKVGASLMGYSFGSQITNNAGGLFEYLPELGAYLRVETVYGFIKDFNLIEFAVQGFIGNHRNILLSGTYNFDNWLGVECKIASITPSDNWRKAFSFIIQPKIRL